MTEPLFLTAFYNGRVIVMTTGRVWDLVWNFCARSVNSKHSSKYEININLISPGPNLNLDSNIQALPCLHRRVNSRTATNGRPRQCQLTWNVQKRQTSRFVNFCLFKQLVPISAPGKPQLGTMGRNDRTRDTCLCTRSHLHASSFSITLYSADKT